MNLLFKNHLTDNQKTTKSLSAIINEVKSQKHQKLANEILCAKSDDLRKELKKQLPTFYPALSSDSPLTPSGIIQIDIDKKDNPSLSINQLKLTLASDPSCIYAFYSPSGGLKAGFKSDFKANENETDESIKLRYAVAFKHLTEHIKEQVPELAFDTCTKSIQQQCYMSHDDNAYVNEGAEELPLNEISIIDTESEEDSRQFRANRATQTNATSNELYGNIEHLISYIPKNLRYVDRLPINYSVLGNLDKQSAFDLLINHWNKPTEEIERQLNDIYNNYKFGHYGTLVNVAKKYGYIPPKPGRSRKNLKPIESNINLPDLLDIDSGNKLLKSYIHEFFNNKKSMFLNASVGLGKTRVVIETLLELPPQTNVLILVKNHELAFQIKNDIDTAIRNKKSNLKGFEHRRIKTRARIFRGKNQPLHFGCEDLNPVLMCNQQIHDGNIIKNITEIDYYPKEYCKTSCPLINDCSYIEQFNDIANIRIATHNDFYNEPSYWSSGTTLTNHYYNYYDAGEYGVVEIENYDLEDGNKCWKPDFIVVDENIIEVNDEPIIETNKSNFESIMYVIDDLNSGMPLEESIQNRKNHLIEEGKKNTKFPRVKFKNLDQYFNDVKQIKLYVKYSEILNYIVCHLKKPEDYDLRHISFVDGSLQLIHPSKVHSRYRDTPTLYLDATANHDVVRKIYGDIDFRVINVKTNDLVKIFQLSNKCLSKKTIREHSPDEIVSGLKKLISKGNYKKVGLISYKKLTKNKSEPSFVAALANQLNIETYSHFGNLRGLNKFEDVDCLIVLGRHSLKPSQTQHIANGIFGYKYRKLDKTYHYFPVRTKSGKVMMVNSMKFCDSELNAIYEHFSIAETIQAIGRGRYVYGNKKDIFLFSNENIGTNIEITSFFEWDDYFEPMIIQDNYEEKLHEIGFIKKSAGEIAKALKKCGFETKGNLRTYVANHYDKICKELIEFGFKLITYSIKNSNYQTRTNEYFVFESDEKLRCYLFEQGDKTIKNLVE